MKSPLLAMLLLLVLAPAPLLAGQKTPWVYPPQMRLAKKTPWKLPSHLIAATPTAPALTVPSQSDSIPDPLDNDSPFGGVPDPNQKGGGGGNTMFVPKTPMK